jgi:adenine-specific DNA-methyltransferase
MQRSCQIPTPSKYIKAMLDEAGYLTDLSGKRVLENSCGKGNVLVEIVQRYISDCKEKGLSTKQIQQGLRQDIVGYEVDQTCVEACIEKLNAILINENIGSINWNINTADYLCSVSEKFDYIIGNPPYITYHNLTDDERIYLKQNFMSCHKGRFDYYYAFVEKSYYSLKSGGTMVYLVPFSIFRNKFAGILRSMIKDDVVSVLDYSGIQVFEGVTTSSAIIHIQKDSNQKTLQYIKNTSKKTVQITKDILLDKWFFGTNTGDKRFGDFYSIHNSVATLCNDAFLITHYNDLDGYIETGGHRIEKEILRPAVSTKSCKYHKQQAVIIFPYKSEKNGYKRYSEKELQQVFPGAYAYISSFFDRLQKRKINCGVRWFEYGRTQALKEVQGEKLIIPMVITSKVTAFLAEDSSIPYAGYFIKPKSECSLQFAKQLLEGHRFYEYVKEKGTPTTKTSYRISVKEIEDFTF